MTPESPPTTTTNSHHDLAAFLAGWFRAWQASRLYGSGHPVVCGAAKQAAEAVTGLRGPRSVVVLPEGFECNGVAIQSDTAAVTEALKAMSTALHDMDIGSVDLGPGLTIADTEAAALALAEAAEDEVIERVNAAGNGRLSLRAVTYRGVHVREAALADPGAATADPGSRARLWSQLNNGILDPASKVTDPRLLARQIGAEVVARPGVALSGLRESLVGTARALADRPRDEQRAGLDRMRELLNGLGPQLRASLGRAAADSRRDSDRASRSTDDTMNARITEALGRGESAGASLSPEAVMLCQKLADLHRVVPDDDAKPSDAVATTVADDNPAEKMADALESLFSRFDPTEFTPDDYRDQIRGTMAPAGPPAPRPGVEGAFAAETLSVRCAHIAHDLLAADTGDPSPALQEVIAASIVPLIDARAFGVLSDRLRCGDPSLSLALSRDAVIDHVLAADVPVPAGDGDSAAASDPSAPVGHDHAVITGLLQLAGDHAVQRITHRMVVGDNPPRNGPAAVRVLAAAPARLRRDALQHVLGPASGPVPLAAAPLLSGMDFNAATDVLKPHLNASQIPERRAAYALLAAAFPQWPARFLSQALRDRDADVQRCVLGRLAAGHDAQHLALAKLVLEGLSAAGALPADVFDRLARETLDRGIEGVWVTARVLRTLASALTPRRAALGTRLARQLAEHRTTPVVRRSLLLWRVMPARWLARLARPAPAGPVTHDAPPPFAIAPSAASEAATPPRSAA